MEHRHLQPSIDLTYTIPDPVANLPCGQLPYVYLQMWKEQVWQMASEHMQKDVPNVSQGETTNFRFSTILEKAKGGCQDPVWYVPEIREGIYA